MKGYGSALLLLLGVWALSNRSSSSGSSSSSSSGGTPPTPGAEPLPATRTGFDGRDAWSRYVRELEPMVRAMLRADGASDVEAFVGASAVSALALSEHSGRNEWSYNVGNLRPVGSQPRVRYPNGVLYRSFPSRLEGAKELVRILRNSRYGPAWRAMIAAVGEGAAIEPLIAAWFASIHDAGYTDGPPASDVAAREAWLLRKVATGAGVADLVTRALANESAPTTTNTVSVAPTDTLVDEQDSALFRAAREQLEAAQAGVDRLRAAMRREQ